MSAYQLTGTEPINPLDPRWEAMAKAGNDAVKPLVYYKSPTPKPLPVLKATTVKAQEPGFFDTLFNFVNRTVETGVNVMDKVGQAKARAATLKNHAELGYNTLQAGWQNNILETPRDTSQDWITGIPNWAVILGGLAVGGLVVYGMSKKGE